MSYLKANTTFSCTKHAPFVHTQPPLQEPPKEVGFIATKITDDDELKGKALDGSHYGKYISKEIKTNAQCCKTHNNCNENTTPDKTDTG